MKYSTHATSCGLIAIVLVAPVAFAQDNPEAPVPDRPETDANERDKSPPTAPESQDGNQQQAAADENATQRNATTQERVEYPEKEPAIPQVDPNTPSGRFGASGQIAISSDAGLFIENTSQSGAGGSTTTLQLRPAFDYFVADNLSLGGFLGVDYSKVPAGSSTTWALGPRVGYNISLSSRFSIWPKAGLSFASTSIENDVAPDTTSSNLALNLFVPVMFHPVEHFFLGFGPALDTDLSGDIKTTTVAGRLTIGGWM